MIVREISMNLKASVTPILILASLLIFSLTPACSRTEVGVIGSTDQFIEILEVEYRSIQDFSAVLSLTGTEEPVKVKVQAISDPRVVRVEYLAPSEMKGQFFLLKEDYLYQYMPGRELVIKKDLTRSNAPVRAANLTPDFLLELIRSEELEVSLIGGPGRLYFPDGEESALDLGTSLSGLDREERDQYSLFEGGRSSLSFGTTNESYVLEAVPLVEGYQFERQVIKFDPDTLLPRELITYFADPEKNPVRALVEQVNKNPGLVPEKLSRLPAEAEIISD